MPGFIHRIAVRAGHRGALDNARRQLEATRDGLAEVDVVASRVPRRPARPGRRRRRPPAA